MKIFFSLMSMAVFLSFTDGHGLPGLADSLSHPPAATGGFAYNLFRLPGIPGAEYVDPVFGSTVRRLTADSVGDDLYARNMWWSADGKLYLHRNTNGTQWADYWAVIEAATGRTTHQGIPIGLASDGGFDPVEPDILYYLSGGSIHKITLNPDATWDDSIYFTAPGGATIGSLGGTLNWLDASGRYMVLRYGAEPSLYLYDRQNLAAGPYAGAIDGSTNIDAGSYVGITPDGKYLVGYDYTFSPRNMGMGTSWLIDHANRQVGAPTRFWSLCGDHGTFISCSDGRDYMIVSNCNNYPEIWRVDITHDAQGLTEEEEKALPNNRRLLRFPNWNQGVHFSSVARGLLKDWVFIASEDGSDTFNGGTADVDGNVTPWFSYRQEIIGFNVLSGEIRRLAHHRSRSVNANYYYTQRLSASWEGEYVAFASNFNQPGVVDEYAIPFGATSETKTEVRAAPGNALKISPNPFNRSISFQAENLRNARISIFSAAGRLLFQQNNIGSNTVVWHADRLPSGIYLAAIKIRGQTFWQKLCLIK
ncbi:MAG: T9SS type A sorting domain-containing protein [Fibrobacterota bacterium]